MNENKKFLILINHIDVSLSNLSSPIRKIHNVGIQGYPEEESWHSTFTINGDSMYTKFSKTDSHFIWNVKSREESKSFKCQRDLETECSGSSSIGMMF